MPVEREIKVAVTDLEEVRGRLRAAGAVLRDPLAFEDNWVLDDDAGSLRSSGRLLRVRRYGREWSVTFKGPARFEGAVKVRPESETTVADGERTLEILAGLGFTPVRRYQKRREAWRLASAVVVLDETPVGTFVEIEGDDGAIAGAARAAGIDPRAAVAGTYLELWQAYRASHPEAPDDMVFP